MDGEQEAEALTQQLAGAERLALVAGLNLAADWIRTHSTHATVFVEDGAGSPVKMLAWVAKERKLDPITCAVCGYVATEFDNLHPFHQERTEVPRIIRSDVKHHQRVGKTEAGLL